MIINTFAVCTKLKPCSQKFFCSTAAMGASEFHSDISNCIAEYRRCSREYHSFKYCLGELHMSSGKTCLQKTPCILILKYLKVAITIIPTDCSENYAVKDQYNSDGVKNLYLPSKLKKVYLLVLQIHQC